MFYKCFINGFIKNCNLQQLQCLTESHNICLILLLSVELFENTEVVATFGKYLQTKLILLSLDCRARIYEQSSVHNKNPSKLVVSTEIIKSKY